MADYDRANYPYGIAKVEVTFVGSTKRVDISNLPANSANVVARKANSARLTDLVRFVFDTRLAVNAAGRGAKAEARRLELEAARASALSEATADELRAALEAAEATA